MAKFQMGVTPSPQSPITARLGSAATAEGRMTDTELFKFVKLAGDSRFDLCAAGDPIEGQICAIESGTADGYTIGSVKQRGRINAICDGTQAAGTGSLSVGQYVVCGTVTAKATALSGTIPAPKVRSATYPPGTEVTNVNQTGELSANTIYAWRIVALGSAGAVGDTCVIERQ